MRAKLASAAALAALLPLSARAADPPAQPLDELVVTATRLPSAIDLVTGAYVVDRAELQARQTPFVEDVLRTVPGVTVTDQGAFGGLAAIRIRGASPDKTLVLVDGVPVGDPADPNGAFDASSLQTADVERIEVLNGPQGSLWGSDAIGGVISITTRELKGIEASAEAGSFSTARAFLGAGISEDRYALSATAAGFSTRGISKADTGTEKDPFRTFTGGLSGRVSLTGELSFDARLRYTYSDVHIDGYPPPNYTLADTPDQDKSRAFQGVIRGHLDGPLGFSNTFSFSDYHLWRENVSDFGGVFLGERRTWRWTARRGQSSDPFGFVVGAERQATRANLSDGAAGDLGVTSVFGVARWAPLKPLTFTGSLRYDDPDAFRSKLSARAAAAWAVGGGFVATASAGDGFKIPTVSEIVCDYCFAPPSPLRPERGRGEDLRLGWRSANGDLTAAITGYHLAVRDQIAYVGLRYINIARTRSEGAEVQAEARLTSELRLNLAYAVTEAIDVSTGQRLLRVPRSTGAATLFWDRGRWGAALTLRGESSQDDVARDGFSPARRPGFVTADLAGSYRVSEQLTVTARVENLTDKRYEESYGYNEPGRAVYVGLKLRP